MLAEKVSQVAHLQGAHPLREQEIASRRLPEHGQQELVGGGEGTDVGCRDGGARFCDYRKGVRNLPLAEVG